MNMRKIAVLGSFAAGAALALAPLASADPAATDPVTSILSSEESILNGMFVTDADLAGVGSDVAPATPSNPFDTIIPSDVTAVQDGTGATPVTTPFDYLIYGANPTEAGLASDPGSYNVLNGAEAKFDDAFNAELYGLENGGAVDPNAADFIGSASSIADATSMANALDEAEYFFNFGLGDLEGFLGIFPSEAATAATSLF
jgi:hypothetical protein